MKTNHNFRLYNFFFLHNCNKTNYSIFLFNKICSYCAASLFSFDRRNLRSIMVGEIILITLVGTILSIPPSIWLGYYWVPLMSQTLSVMEFYVRLVPLAVSFAIPVISAVISVAPLMRVLNRIDLQVVMRNRDPQ